MLSGFPHRFWRGLVLILALTERYWLLGLFVFWKRVGMTPEKLAHFLLLCDRVFLAAFVYTKFV